MIFKFLNGLLRPNKPAELSTSTLAVSRRGFLIGTGAMLAVPMVLKFESIAEAQAAIFEATKAHPELVWVLDFSIFRHVITASVLEVTDLGSLGAGRFVAPDNMATILEDRYARLARPGIDIALTPQDLGLDAGSLVPQRKMSAGFVYGTKSNRVADIGAARDLERSINRIEGCPDLIKTRPVQSFQVGDRKRDIAPMSENAAYTKEVFGRLPDYSEIDSEAKNILRKYPL